MSLLSAKLMYMLPQKAKFSGVVNTHAAVLNAVSETESSVFPLESDVMKFEMLPPGQDATSIIPNEIIGDNQSLNVIVRRNVRAGRRISWHKMPIITDLGLLIISINVLGLMPSATPNITIASTIFRAIIPPFPPIWTSRLSNISITSGFMV